MKTISKASTCVKEYDSWIDLHNNHIHIRVEKSALSISQIKVDPDGKGDFGKNILLSDSAGLHAFAKTYDKQTHGKQTCYGSSTATANPTVRSIASTGSTVKIRHTAAGLLEVDLRHFDLVTDKHVLAHERWILQLGNGPGFSIAYEAYAVIPLEYISLRCFMGATYRNGKIPPELLVSSLTESEDYYFPMPLTGSSIFTLSLAGARNASMTVSPNDGDRIHFFYDSDRVVFDVQHTKLKGIAGDSRVCQPIEAASKICVPAVSFYLHKEKDRTLWNGYAKRYSFPEIRVPDIAMQEAIRCAWHLDLVPNIWRDDSIMVCLRRGCGFYNFTPDMWLPSQALVWSSSPYPREVVKHLLLKLANSQNLAGQFPWAFNDTGPHYDDCKAGQLKSGYLEISANCLAVVQTLNYYLWTGDVDLLDQMMPALCKGISHLTDGSSERLSLGRDGILHTAYPFVDWRDWIYARNRVTLVNMLYYWGLISLADLEQATGDSRSSQAYHRQAEELKSSINKVFWRESKGYYVGWVDGTTVEHDRFETDTNALAVFLGVADGAKAASIRDFFVQHDDEMGVVPVRWCYPQWISNERGMYDYDEETIDPSLECMLAWDNGEAGGWGRLTWPYIQMWKKMGDYRHAQQKVKAYAGIYSKNVHAMESYHLDGKGFSQYGYAENAAALLCTVMDTIFGLAPNLSGLRIDPTVYRDWPTISLGGLVYRGAVLNITVDNSAEVIHGIKEFYINGTLQRTNVFPASMATGHHELKIVMGIRS